VTDAGGLSPQPAMSVVVIAPGSYRTFAPTIRSLARQSVAGRLELLCVATSAAELEPDTAELAAFLRWRVVELGEIPSVSAANAAGVRASTAPVVALVENHVFVQPGWAEALLAAHDAGWDAVGPAMGNANPRSLVGTASFLIAYSQWSKPTESGPADDLPGHNSSYKRALLLEYGERLESRLETESVLHAELRAKGRRLYLAAGARILHLNPTRLAAYTEEIHHYGRLFAAARAASWSFPRRAAYCAGSPLLPLLRLARLWRYLPRLGLLRLVPLLALLFLGLSASALGELIGYAVGEGDAAARMRDFEIHRERQVGGA